MTPVCLSRLHSSRCFLPRSSSRLGGSSDWPKALPAQPRSPRFMPPQTTLRHVQEPPVAHRLNRHHLTVCAPRPGHQNPMDYPRLRHHIRPLKSAQFPHPITNYPICVHPRSSAVASGHSPPSASFSTACARSSCVGSMYRVSVRISRCPEILATVARSAPHSRTSRVNTVCRS